MFTKTIKKEKVTTKYKKMWKTMKNIYMEKEKNEREGKGGHRN